MLDPLSPQLLESAARRGNTCESYLHKRLKNYVANHPTSVGLNKSLSPGNKEVELPSGDKVDVLFQNKRCRIAVEVKSRISDEFDLLRGIFQCVKYREILRACGKVDEQSYKVDARLAIEGILSKELTRTSNNLVLKLLRTFVLMVNKITH